MDPIVGKDTIVAIGDGAGVEVFTAVASLLSVGELAETRDTVDVTTFDSVDDYRVFMGNKLIDAGEVTLELLSDEADVSQAAFRAKLTDSLPSNIKITWPDTAATNVTLSTLVTAVSKATPMDDKVSFNVTLKISGKPTWA